MLKGEKSIRGGIEDLLCPFTDMYITQGTEGSSHKGTKAIDVRGRERGVRYPYYAPCTVKCIKTYPSNGQVMWQSVNKVRFADGSIDYVTFMTAHDNSMDSYKGQIVEQGSQLGNMGNKGNATGVHCHIEVSQSSDTSFYKNKYGIYTMNNEYDLDDCYFVDNTNILYGMGGNWKTTDKVPVTSQPTTGDTRNYINLSPKADTWAFYRVGDAPVKKNAIGTLKPSKFGGLSYYIYQYCDGNTTAVIQTRDYGKVKIYIKHELASVTVGSYKYGLVE